MELVYFLLGSNLGDRNWYLKEACRLLEKTVGRMVRSSAVYETQSWGVSDLPDYLNMVVEMETSLLPTVVLKKTQEIEEKLHRERTKKWHSRTIDVDILFFGKVIVNLPELKIPHPELHNRLFTLVPLDELIPDFIHPVLHKTVHSLKQEVNDGLLVKKYKLTN
ncbi:2-amino-4-hydroxy-6-hydroxymethyldihydropteridine diphosphokinase [Mucilaginibacter arboris]|uniref:2-amino-4-hydroxy-6-hydroxymethyldihydropteridine pyrophosphokinase n=1 Tax=Mucilaginibacter arboris TaxID=2682090 RepID=A0A7K1SYA4_9SPHI|nr:2-amino-4-hydroxy-6-hydroxymethyldihydropteridine diphosphokinase [Mucilaginibacter arboris]MVN22301.1 2-amino-4-hydroxy-6-hydroxymethyldihydropteridine diphosphokinase [Mucilaginibacter arboris]